MSAVLRGDELCVMNKNVCDTIHYTLQDTKYNTLYNKILIHYTMKLGGH